ncbi:Kv channel-interacting protein 1-like isoform X3 [Varroa jacobsoni]|uniref:EF-hand domain-containing protein n=2 Tax=Varroa destructor TaxID=109461 RepID=A0A7M7K7M9_VARDE|nr:Kv channel-interacting protein 1-like isoform X1 [Varroa destructor]XP_022695336.1 Kv channel-interacting protein 1-like isoform X3 [Varroa jacobsoni]
MALVSMFMGFTGFFKAGKSNALLRGRYSKAEVEEETFGPRYKPERLDELCKNTKFDRDEIRLIYQGFKQECPTGLVDEDAFKLIFAQFFPQGDASQYAHYVFNTMKQYGHNGCLTFEQFLQVLSSLSRGSVTEKVQWIFGLYDLNGDGFISRAEMLRVVSAIYDMLGHWTQPQVNEHTAREHVDKIFNLIDADHDGLVSFDEFLEWCQRTANTVLIGLDKPFSAPFFRKEDVRSSFKYLSFHGVNNS